MSSIPSISNSTIAAQAGKQHIPIIILTFMIMQETASVVSRSIRVEADGLNENCAMQKAEIAHLRNLHLKHTPDEQIDHHVDHHSHYHPHFHHGLLKLYSTYTTRRTTISNLDEIQNAKNSNLQINAEREQIQGAIGNLTIRATVDETGFTTRSNKVNITFQQALHLLDTFVTLTFCAMIRRKIT